MYKGGRINACDNMGKTDKHWLDRYHEGDVEALGELVNSYRRPLYGFIHKMVNTPGEADEIFQETWIRAIRHLDDFKSGKLLSWLFRIARNLVIDAARRKRPGISLDYRDEEGVSWSERVPSPITGPADAASDRELGRNITAAVSRLPVEQKEVFLMRIDGNLPFREIARIQGISINTALARMQYALEKLKTELDMEYRTLGR